jgi:hypothetical protein
MNRREFLKKSLEGIVIGNIPLIYNCVKNPVEPDFNFSQSNYFYYYYDQKIYLKPNLSIYAIKFKDGVDDNKKRDVLLKNNLTLFLDNPISNLYLVKVLTNNIDKKEDFIKIPEIEYVSYYFITQNGYELFLTNSFFAKFKLDVSSEEINLFNKEYSAKIVGEYGHNYYLLEIPWNSPQNSLKIANIYHESNLVEHASPNYAEKVKY